ncbi:MAG: hypothetical protein ACFFCZ_19530 [Promethearchaeota archaeon]
MDNKFKLFLSFYEFTDKGIELTLSEDIPFLKKPELELIGTYYSMIFQTSQPDQALLFGPLPVAYHYDQLVFVYANEIKDENMKDSRVVNRGYMTPLFILIFFPTQYDQICSRSRIVIQKTLSEWFLRTEDIKEITLESLKNLKSLLTEAILKEEKQFTTSQVSASIKTVLGKNIDFLNTIGRSLGRPLRIGIFGSTNDELLLLQSAISQIFPLLRGMNTSSDEKFVVYRFSDLYIEGGTLETKELVDFKKTVALMHTSSWKNVPKHFDGILLTIPIPSDGEVITKNIQTVLRNTPNFCPISLFIRYNSDYSDGISTTPIPKAISEADKRTISLFEVRDDQNTIQTALIDLVTKLVPTLQSKA